MMTKLFILIWFLNGIFISVYPQKLSPGRYWVPLTDKDGNIFNINAPEDFLSERAIHRRNKQGISISDEDLPVTKIYVDSLRKLGLSILGTSRWFNAVIVESYDTVTLNVLQTLSFVKNFNYSVPLKGLTLSLSAETKNTEKYLANTSSETEYGIAEKQIDILHGKSLHSSGYRGKGMIIAVIDGGFYKVDSYSAFDSLWLNNRIIAWYDFTEPYNPAFFNGDSHGMSVLSIMGGNIPGEFVGTAPEASFLLLRSEVSQSENLIEEAWWILAAEYADSAGADVINTSLGYSTFDDLTMNYSISDMNGRTAISTLAAEKAFSKGMIIVVSAGNEGNKPWGKITSPSDGNHVLAVGAIDSSKYLAPFSSFGPTTDLRIKPDVVAVGVETAIITSSGVPGNGNGTSYSAPQIAGMISCLWQALPEKTNLEIIDAVRRSSSMYYTPNNFFGYGVPNFTLALNQLSSSPHMIADDELIVIPNPSRGTFEIRLRNPKEFVNQVLIYDMMGREVAMINNPEVHSGYIRISELNYFQAGMYFIIVRTLEQDYSAKLIKLSW